MPGKDAQPRATAASFHPCQKPPLPTKTPTLAKVSGAFNHGKGGAAEGWIVVHWQFGNSGSCEG